MLKLDDSCFQPLCRLYGYPTKSSYARKYNLLSTTVIGIVHCRILQAHRTIPFPSFLLISIQLEYLIALTLLDRTTLSLLFLIIYLSKFTIDVYFVTYLRLVHT